MTATYIPFDRDLVLPVRRVSVKVPRQRWMVHNIGQGARLEDVLFSWKVIGHYRYFR
ncbi:MAG: DUF1287 domain-containing protein [Acidobacteriota bacterium]